MGVQNSDRSRRWFVEVWNERRDSAIEELLGEDGVGHLEDGDVIGAEGFRQVQGEFLSAFPDLKFEIEDVISDGDDVVVRWSVSGTHAGDGLGLEATQQPMVARGMTWQRYKDGKMVEGWDSWNQEALMQRLRDGSAEQRDRSGRRRAELAARIRLIRQELFGENGGPELARKLGIPSRTLYNYETGVTIPAEVLLEFIELTGARPAWLLRGEPPRYEGGDSPAAKVE